MTEKSAVVVYEDGKYVLYSSGGRVLSRHDNAEDAYRVEHSAQRRKKKPAVRSDKVAALRTALAGCRKSAGMTKTIGAVPVAVVSPQGKTVATADVEFADSDEKRALGLSKRANIRPGTGMIFSTPGPFWMKDCVVPLDIAFLDKKGEILDIRAMPVLEVQDYMRPRYVSRRPGACAAFEAPAGWFKSAGIGIGYQVVVGAEGLGDAS